MYASDKSHSCAINCMAPQQQYMQLAAHPWGNFYKHHIAKVWHDVQQAISTNAGNGMGKISTTTLIY